MDFSLFVKSLHGFIPSFQFQFSLFWWMKSVFKTDDSSIYLFLCISSDRWLLCASDFILDRMDFIFFFFFLKWMPIDFNCDDEWWNHYNYHYIVVFIGSLSIHRYIQFWNISTVEAAAAFFYHLNLNRFVSTNSTSVEHNSIRSKEEHTFFELKFKFTFES